MSVNQPDTSPVPQEYASAQESGSGEIGEERSDAWRPPPAQPLRIISALILTASGATLYGFVLTSFWSSPSLGIHDRFPYPAYALIGLALLSALAGLGLSLGIWSP